MEVGLKVAPFDVGGFTVLSLWSQGAPFVKEGPVGADGIVNLMA
jgi:hypothetical protein